LNDGVFGFLSPIGAPSAPLACLPIRLFGPCNAVLGSWGNQSTQLTIIVYIFFIVIDLVFFLGLVDPHARPFLLQLLTRGNFEIGKTLSERRSLGG